MNSQEKQAAVEELSKNFGSAPAAFLVDYKGCTCEELTGLRRELRPSGARFAVVKNTLAKRAVENTPAEGLNSFFEGPIGVVWSDTDPVAPAKVVSQFAKDRDAFQIRAGVVEGQVVDVSAIESLASLPGREELFAKLLSLINAPATRLLQTINAPASNVVRLLEAWRSKLEEK